MPTVPVTYDLTDLGLSLHYMARRIRMWPQANMAEGFANCENHDNS